MEVLDIGDAVLQYCNAMPCNYFGKETSVMIESDILHLHSHITVSAFEYSPQRSDT